METKLARPRMPRTLVLLRLYSAVSVWQHPACVSTFATIKRQKVSTDYKHNIFQYSRQFWSTLWTRRASSRNCHGRTRQSRSCSAVSVLPSPRRYVARSSVKRPPSSMRTWSQNCKKLQSRRASRQTYITTTRACRALHKS